MKKRMIDADALLNEIEHAQWWNASDKDNAIDLVYKLIDRGNRSCGEIEQDARRRQ